MSLSFFYVENLNHQQEIVTLSEDTSKHITQVLRMKAGDPLLLMDGKGSKAQAIIVNENRKKCEVRLSVRETTAPPQNKVIIAISLLKNAARFEWFLEKATEIGVSEIIPILCSRTEKEKFRHDRMNTIVISAMLQSQQCWLPLLHQPMPFSTVVHQYQSDLSCQKFIAHCLPEEKQPLRQMDAGHTIILIGPEGDFTAAEIKEALRSGYKAVTLGATRLRTETAGIVAATLLCCSV